MYRVESCVRTDGQISGGLTYKSAYALKSRKVYIDSCEHMAMRLG